MKGKLFDVVLCAILLVGVCLLTSHKESKKDMFPDWDYREMKAHGRTYGIWINGAGGIEVRDLNEDSLNTRTMQMYP